VADGRQVSDENTIIEAQENWEVIVIVAVLVLPWISEAKL